MLKAIIALIVIVIAILMLNHFYQKSTLELNSNEVKLKVNNQEVLLTYQTRKNIPTTLSNVQIERSEVLVGDELLYFESAQTENLYEFNYNPEQIVSILFDAKRTEPLFSKNGLQAIKITLADSRIVNLFTTQHDTKELQLVYGFSDKKFKEVVEQLSSTTKVSDSSGSFTLSEPLAKWSVEHVDIEGVVSSIDH